VNHIVPEKGYVVNKRLQKDLSIEVNKLKMSPEYSECKQTIEEAMHQFNNMAIISKDPSVFINNFFDDLKSHVNMRRNYLKNQVDKYADELIQSIENNQSNCIKLSQETSQLSKNIEDSKKQLDELKNHLDTFVIDTLNFDSIKASAEDLIERFSQMQTEYRESLLLHQDYMFDFDDDDPTKSIEYFFGKIIDTKMIDRIVKIIFIFI
jgi:F0F1-type ATP synthase gamma subunit